MLRASRRRLLPLGLLLAGLLVSTPARAQEPTFQVDGHTYDVAQITHEDPVLEELFSMAQDVGFRIGTWGGSSRDFLLGRGSPPEFSDVDMVYDSKELKSALMADGVLGMFRKLGRIGKAYWRIVRIGGFEAVRRYTWLDAQREKPLTMSIQKLMDSGSLSLNRVGLMSDGTVYDPSGGLRDALDGKLRYVASRPIKIMVEEFDDVHNPSPADVLRAVRFKVQYPELEWAEGTMERLRKIMSYYGPDSPYTRAMAERSRGVSGALGKLVPGFLKKPVSAVKNRFGRHTHADLLPYVEKNLGKLLASTTDPAESLALCRELGLDVFARSVGLGEYVDELESRAAGQPARSVDPTTPGLDEPASTDAGRGEAAWRRIADQAYENYLQAEQEGDPAAAALQYRIYQRAQSLREGTP